VAGAQLDHGVAIYHCPAVRGRVELQAQGLDRALDPLRDRSRRQPAAEGDRDLGGRSSHRQRLAVSVRGGASRSSTSRATRRDRTSPAFRREPSRDRSDSALGLFAVTDRTIDAEFRRTGPVRFGRFAATADDASGVGAHTNQRGDPELGQIGSRHSANRRAISHRRRARARGRRRQAVRGAIGGTAEVSPRWSRMVAVRSKWVRNASTSTRSRSPAPGDVLTEHAAEQRGPVEMASRL